LDSRTTSVHQANITYMTPTKPMANMIQVISCIQSTAPNSITNPETAPMNGRTEGSRM